MIPYIAILIVLVAAILWQLYKQNESFVGGSTDPFVPIKITDTSTMQNTLDNISSFLQKLYELKGLYATKVFKPVLNETEAKLLGYTVTKDSTGKVTILGDTSIEMIRKKINDDIQMYEMQVEGAQNSVKSGEVRLGAKIVDSIYADSTLSADQKKKNAITLIDTLNANNELVAKKINALFDIYYKEYPLPAKAVEAPKPTATPVVAAAAPVEKPAETKPVDASTELTKSKIQVVCSVPAPIVKEVPVLTNEMEMRLAQKVAKQVNEEVLSQLKYRNPLEDLYDSSIRLLGIQNKNGSGLQGYELIQQTPSPSANQRRQLRIPEQPAIQMDVGQYMP